eukprot:scaffold1007_cov176-Amphora_coffeaeformis.AAC.32
MPWVPETNWYPRSRGRPQTPRYMLVKGPCPKVELQHNFEWGEPNEYRPRPTRDCPRQRRKNKPPGCTHTTRRRRYY